MVFTIDWQHLCGVQKLPSLRTRVSSPEKDDQNLPFLGMFTSHQAKLRMHVGLGSPEEIKMGVFLGYIWHERRDKGVSRGDCRCFPVKEEDYVCNVVRLYTL
tara:strand:- start:171 stop:476 length:306 start_codon:yes stop_codon:yes gene_type:complete